MLGLVEELLQQMRAPRCKAARFLHQHFETGRGAGAPEHADHVEKLPDLGVDGVLDRPQRCS